MTTEAMTAQLRLQDWASGNGRSARLDARASSKVEGLVAWTGVAVWERSGFSVVVESGPCRDPESVAERLIELLEAAGVTVL